MHVSILQSGLLSVRDECVSNVHTAVINQYTYKIIQDKMWIVSKKHHVFSSDSDIMNMSDL